MGTVWGTEIPRHEYKESAFTFGFDVLRGRIRPRVLAPHRPDARDAPLFPPPEMADFLNAHGSQPVRIWARAAEMDMNDPIVTALSGDPDTWRRRHVYAFCKRAQVHPACLLPKEPLRPWPLAVVQALELVSQDNNFSDFDRDLAFRASLQEIEHCGEVATNCKPLVELLCAMRSWREFMAAHDSEEPPKGFTYTGPKVARGFYNATRNTPDQLWPALPGMRATFLEAAEATQLIHFEAGEEYKAMQDRRDRIGATLFGPDAARIFRKVIANTGVRLTTESLSNYFNNMAYVAVTAPEILGPKLHQDVFWKAGRDGFDSVEDMALAFVRMEERIVRLIHAQTAAQDRIKTASLYLSRIDSAYGMDQTMRGGVEENVFGSIRNLESLSSKGRMATPPELERLLVIPNRTALPSPPAAQRA